MSFISSIIGAAERSGTLFAVEKEWHWSGTHYQRTAQDSRASLDADRVRILPALQPMYGDHTALWMRRWFFLATSGPFGHDEGRE